MHAQALPMVKVLSGEQLFVIPDYQRRYRWQIEQWEQYFEDVVDEVDQPIPVNLEQPVGHFVGSIVLESRQVLDYPGLLQKVVVDGQQRLSTTFVLLAAIRDSAKQRGEERLSRKIEQLYVSNLEWENTPAELKFRPSRLDQKSYEETMKGEPDGRYGEAYRYFMDAIQEFEKDKPGPNSLNALFESLLKRIVVVQIAVTDEDPVNAIFNTLNSKGLPLSPGDLVKNEILMYLDDATAEFAHQNLWEPVERALVSDTKQKFDDSKLVSFLWAREVIKEPKLSKRNLFNQFEKTVKKLKKVTKEKGVSFGPSAHQLLEEIHSDFLLYELMLAPEQINDPRHDNLGLTIDERTSIQNELRLLLEWDVTLHHPLGLWAFKELQQGKLNAEQLVSLLKSTSSFLIRRALAGAPTNNLNSIMSKLPSQISQDSSPDPAFVLRKLLGKEIWPDDQEILAKIQTLPIAASIKKQQLLLILQRSLGVEGNVIRRIVPATLNSGWFEVPNGLVVPLAGRRTFVNNLGNLLMEGLTRKATFKNAEEWQAAIDSVEQKALDDYQLSNEFDAQELQSYRRRAESIVGYWIENLEEPFCENADETSLVEDISFLIDSMPEEGWTTIDDLASYFSVTKGAVFEVLTTISTYQISFVRNEDGSPLDGVEQSVADAVAKSYGAIREAAARLTVDDLYALTVEESTSAETEL